jgi:Ca-activated chloride channel homolog
MNVKKIYLQFLFLLLLLQVSPAQAYSWQDLWLRPDQQAKHLLDAGKAQKAAEKFHNPLWKGIAYYRAGLYQEATKEFANFNSPLAHYNRGNSLAQVGEYRRAIAAYEETLKINPQHQDAKYNRDLIVKLLQDSKKSPQKNQSQQQSNKEKNNNQNKSQAEQNKKDKNKEDDKSKDQSSEQNNSQKNNEQSKQTQNQPEKNPPQNPQPQSNKPNLADKENKPILLQKREQQQEMQQWLRRIPDDPGGLLKQKFLRDHLRSLDNYNQGE